MNYGMIHCPIHVMSAIFFCFESNARILFKCCRKIHVIHEHKQQTANTFPYVWNACVNIRLKRLINHVANESFENQLAIETAAITQMLYHILSVCSEFEFMSVAYLCFAHEYQSSIKWNCDDFPSTMSCIRHLFRLTRLKTFHLQLYRSLLSLR